MNPETPQTTPQPPHIINEPLMDETQVSHMTGISRGTLRNMRFLKKGIPFLKIGRLVRYDPHDVREFLKSCRREVENLESLEEQPTPTSSEECQTL